MDTAISRKLFQWADSKRRFLFLGLGVISGGILAYGLSLMNYPGISAALGIGLLAGVVTTPSRRSAAENDAELFTSGEDSPPAFSEEWPELAMAHGSISESLHRLAGQTDPILLEVATVRLAAIQEEIRSLADGRVVFSATEGWRTVYDQILCSPGMDCYRSVAWMRSEDYWQDSPGQQSMQINFKLLQEGVSIERILILNDFFWPPAAAMPAQDIRRWIDEQYQRGISIRLVRESEIDTEADLLCDMGIYGTRATGTLELDPQCRTTRFMFDFSPEGVRLAEQRWKRLSLYAKSYQDLLDRVASHR